MTKNNSGIFNHWNDVVSETRNEIVFEGRNKKYGAYFLRRNHNKLVAVSLLITASLFTIGIGFPKILNYFSNEVEEVEVPLVITSVDLTPPPPLDDTEPPPPPPPPPPVIETVKFTPPVVTDEEVIDEPPPIQTDELPEISTVTQEGDGIEDIIIPDELAVGVVQPVEDEIFQFVQKEASFPGGEEALFNFLRQNIVYPEIERENGVSGTCYVKFIVEKDGSITNVEILKGVSNGPLCDKEALRVVKKMPKWEPGKNSGRSVRSYYRMPIKFTLN